MDSEGSLNINIQYLLITDTYCHPKAETLFYSAAEMGLTVDQVLEYIGSFGYYQIRLLFILSFIEWFPVGFQVLLMTFIAAEPKWQCVANSSECTVPGLFKPGHDYYKKRCNMNRSQWEFTNEFTSVATEASVKCSFNRR